MANINVKINGKLVAVPEGTTILNAAKKVGVEIPTLCYYNLEEFNVKNCTGSCRVCVVEVKGRPNLMPSCATPAMEGMDIVTNTPRVLNARRANLQLLLSNHPFECLTCAKSGKCELQELAARFEISEVKYEGKKTSYDIDIAHEAIIRDPNKCVMCRRCETACNVMQKVGVLSGTERGFGAVVGTFSHVPLAETQCTFCGQCVSACPTGALVAVNANQKVIDALYNPKKTTVIQVAPAVRVAIGEEFGLPPGTVSTGKLAAALRALHFDYVFDTNWSADLTIMEEGTELISRIQKGENLPILTSCCPGWVNFLESQFPELVNVPSTAKSPQQMFGAVVKRAWAPKKGLNPADVTVVSVMPCVAKKYEAARPEFSVDGVRDVDVVITTRELAKLIKEAGINFNDLPDEDFDSPLGQSTGAADIFGTAGGVLEAALRTVSELVTGKPLANVDFKDVRGIDGIKEANIQIGDLTIKVAQASGLGNARELLRRIKNKEVNYHAIEIMACPGGCINGGGQPYHHGNTDVVKARQQALYKIDAGKPIRKSHENKEVMAIYKEFYGEPNSKLAHEHLHTHYYAKNEEIDL